VLWLVSGLAFTKYRCEICQPILHICRKINAVYECLLDFYLFSCLLVSAVGCANPVLGAGMWQRRDSTSSSDDVIIVGCRTTNERWRLTCVGGAWTGDVIGNCSTGTSYSCFSLTQFNTLDGGTR